MYNIRGDQLPAFIAGYILAFLIHFIGLLLLRKVKFHPTNQRILMIHLALTELSTNLFQTVVYVLLMLGRCERDSVCDFVDHFFYTLVFGTSKLIMIYIICDRLLDIRLHLKYSIYFTEQKVKRISLALWLFCCVFASTVVLVRILYNEAAQLLGTICFSFYVALDVIIVISALVTYSFLYIKVRHFHAIDCNQNKVRRGSTSRASRRSKFMLPCLIIATYLIFNTTGDIMLFYNAYFMNGGQYTKSVISEVAHWLWILGWISDGILYIFMQKSIKEKLKSGFRKNRVGPTH